MLKLFTLFEIRKIVSYFKTRTLAKVITSALFLGVFVFVGLGIYSFFVSGFWFINLEAVEDIKLALTLFIYEVFLLVLMLVIMFSAMVTGIFNLFRGERNEWLLSSPLYTIFPRWIFIKSLLTSLFPSLVMFLPAVLAFNRVYHLGSLSLFFILVSVVLFLITITTITLSVTLLVAFLYYKLTQAVKSISFSFKGLVVILLGIISVLVLYTWKIVSAIDLVKLFKAEDEPDVALSISNISSHFQWLPTHPFALEIINWQHSQTTDALINVGILGLIALLGIILWEKVSYLFYPLWLRFQEGGAQTDSRFSVFSKNKQSYQFTGGSTLALFKKELLVSSRNFKGVLWSAFISFIWLMQIVANVIMKHNVQRYEADISQKIILLQAIQFIIAVYFISAFTLRFVFPSFSVEKKTSWILASSPLSFKKIFFSKYLFYTLFFVLLGTIMSYINILVLHVPFENALFSVLLFVSVVIFTVTFGLSLGALFPSLETDDPETISTSMPGLFFTALALIYGALSDFILYQALLQKNMMWLVLFTLFTLCISALLLLKTPSIAKKKALL